MVVYAVGWGDGFVLVGVVDADDVDSVVFVVLVLLLLAGVLRWLWVSSGGWRAWCG